MTLATEDLVEPRERDLLARYRTKHPDVVALARLASLAHHIEPELLRALRIELSHLFPEESRPRVGTESALWFSRLVETRGPDGITLLPRLRSALREELKAAGLVERCYAVLERLHGRAPPVTVWEEELVYLGLTDAINRGQREERFERLVLRAARAIQTGSRETLESWIADMWPRLPARTLQDPALGRLRRTVDSRRAQARTPSDADVLGARIEVRKVGHSLLVGFLGGAGDYAIDVPDADAVVVELENDESRFTLSIPRGQSREAESWDYPVTVRASDGREYFLSRRPQPAPAHAAYSILEGHTDAVWCVAVSPDGSFGVTGSADGTVRVWDLKTHKLSMTYRGHQGAVLAVTVAPSLRLIVSGSEDRTVRVWSVDEPGTEPLLLTKHGGDVNAVAVWADGVVQSGSDDGTIRSWVRGRPRPPPALDTRHPVLAFHHWDGEERTLALAERKVTFWRRESRLEALKKRATPAASAFAPPRHFVAEWQYEPQRDMRTLAVAPDGRHAALGAFDGTITWLDMETREAIFVLEGHHAPVYGLCVTSDGKRLVSVSGDCTLRVWDLTSGVCTNTLGADAELVGLAVTPDGTRAVSGSNGLRAFVWDLEHEPRVTHQYARVLVVGDRHVGKTMLTRHMVDMATSVALSGDAFPSSFTVTDEATGARREVEFLELPASNECRVLGPLFLRGASAILLVMDPSKSFALHTAASWLERLRETFPLPPLRVVAVTRMGDTPIAPADIEQFKKQYEITSWHEVGRFSSERVVELNHALVGSISWQETGPVDPALLDTMRRAAAVMRMAAAVHRHELFESTRALFGPDHLDEDALLAGLLELADQRVVMYLKASDLVVLQMDYVRHIAAAIVRTAALQPTGSLPQSAVLDGKLSWDDGPRADHQIERLVSAGVLNLLLEESICFKPHENDETLVFPALLRPLEPLLDSREPSFALIFSGKREIAQAMVAYELLRTKSFGKVQLWNNGAVVGDKDQCYVLFEQTADYNRASILFDVNVSLDAQRAFAAQIESCLLAKSEVVLARRVLLVDVREHSGLAMLLQDRFHRRGHFVRVGSIADVKEVNRLRALYAQTDCIVLVAPAGDSLLEFTGRAVRGFQRPPDRVKPTSSFREAVEGSLIPQEFRPRLLQVAVYAETESDGVRYTIEDVEHENASKTHEQLVDLSDEALCQAVLDHVEG